MGVNSSDIKEKIENKISRFDREILYESITRILHKSSRKFEEKNAKDDRYLLQHVLNAMQNDLNCKFTFVNAVFCYINEYLLL